MSKQEVIQQAADALALARASRQPIAPLATKFDLSGVEAAYAVANANTRARLASGRRISRASCPQLRPATGSTRFRTWAARSPWISLLAGSAPWRG